MIDSDELDYGNSDFVYYSPGVDYALRDVINQFVFDEDDAVFDFGYGKGGALLQFKDAGAGKIGGIELDGKIRDIAMVNYDKLGVDKRGLLLGDAARVTYELDGYNYIFFYNPFQGETFRMVIKNIEESVKRKPRKVTIIYSGPYCSEYILQDGMFYLSKKIYTDYDVRDVHIYANK